MLTKSKMEKSHTAMPIKKPGRIDALEALYSGEL